MKVQRNIIFRVIENYLSLLCEKKQFLCEKNNISTIESCQQAALGDGAMNRAINKITFNR
ncbi:MAG: hypothetical protein ACK5IJ_05000 [Mangrovibacterium sp.]